MASRRSSPRESDRVQTRTGSANAERIRSGDMSEALTEVLCEETRLPRTSTQEAKDLEGEKSVARVKSSSPTGSEGRDRPLKKVKTNGSDHRLGVSGEAAVAKPFHWQFSHSKITLLRKTRTVLLTWPWRLITSSRRLWKAPSGHRERANAAQLAAAEKLGNQAASLEARLRVVSNERKSALEKISFLEAKVESSANKFSDDLCRATYDAKKALAGSYLDVLVSLKEKCKKKKAATDCEACLREVMANIDLLKEIMNNNLLASDELLRLRTKEVELGSELDVMVVSDFSVGKLDLPQISEDLPKDFFAKAPSAADDVTKCLGGQFEDGEFGIEE
ncbi:hypothetical protein F2Q68_00022321 [Brassica cretica]|uniref:Uncharacterized protein n=1 Tax=Brassica cretica TaxID=69181 RepID=A0A8S9FXV8_BRACR|nr:hypothetical protein F2Q68_00022321 [Brassica cretica]